ncbi:hypothetical protein [Anaerotalea alkaliphila]|uniref:Uncharacterized protein n=1 Tax=Anaerotalea alkaliphila TaxID=2662126 RepID=A0A7X5KN29_9FIRM|nr:hypothetical protein [Anaerotalea alkaliphila]NDL68566.1 hypothetical protein [Anaerotalea alkaliphila]
MRGPSEADRGFAVELAGPSDGKALLALYEDGAFPGGISVLFTRRPDAWFSLAREGEVEVVVVRDLGTGRIAAMGACILRPAWINGQVGRTGYLTGLKSLGEYRGRVPLGPRAYRLLYEATRERVDVYYTTILEENLAARRMLEKPRRNMPAYRELGGYTVHCLATGGFGGFPGLCGLRGFRPWDDKKGMVLTGGSWEELWSLYGPRAPEWNFSQTGRPWGVEESDIRLLRDGSGQPVAGCVLWNQAAVKQHIPMEYRGVYRLLRHLPLELAGYPRLPAPGVPAREAGFALLCSREGDPESLALLVEKTAREAAGHDYLLLGLFQDHPLAPHLEKFRGIRYRSRLYTVHWDGEGILPDGRPVGLDVGLL